jgi:hypothetical protein
MMQILYKFRHNLRRYQDHIIVFSTNRKEFFELLFVVFHTLSNLGLFLKGSKVKILGTTINLLGKEIVNGTIRANPHIISNLRGMTSINMTTKRMLKRFLGTCTYIGDHIRYRSEILHKLRTESIGQNGALIKWTFELRAELEKTHQLMDNLLHLYLVDPNKDIFAVFDSSYLASAGFFYQKYGEEKRFIKIFSRRRSDSNNKFKPSSCYLEFSGILAGMLGAQVEIERCLKKIIITTDSKNVADLFNKMKNDMVPSTDRKINEIFSKLCNFNYEINYASCSSPAIEFADYISRTPAASIPCSGCSICEAVESKDNFFNHVRTISSQVGLYKFETELMPTMTYENFERLQLPVSTSGLNQELTHPFSDRGWQNSLVAKPDLSSLSEDHDSMLMALGIGRKIIDEKLTVHDILSNEKLLDERQNSDSNIRKAKVCIKEGRDPP